MGEENLLDGEKSKRKVALSLSSLLLLLFLLFCLLPLMDLVVVVAGHAMCIKCGYLIFFVVFERYFALEKFCTLPKSKKKKLFLQMLLERK